MADRAYGSLHRRVRKHLLEVTPPGTMCPFFGIDPKCPGPMWPGAELLELHHTDPAAKQRGEPGDTLAHRACNRRTAKPLPPEVRARKQRQAEKEAATLTAARPGPRCNHATPLPREPFREGGCGCADPFGHYVKLAAKAKAAGTVVTVEHPEQPCWGGCGGYTHSRFW